VLLGWELARRGDVGADVPAQVLELRAAQGEVQAAVDSRTGRRDGVGLGLPLVEVDDRDDLVASEAVVDAPEGPGVVEPGLRGS
jgi:hypothetical protein